MAAALVDLDAHLRPPDSHGWRMTPTVTIHESQKVADPTRPGRFVYGPVKVKLMVAPDHGRTLRVS